MAASECLITTRGREDKSLKIWNFKLHVAAYSRIFLLPFEIALQLGSLRSVKGLTDHVFHSAKRGEEREFYRTMGKGREALRK